MLTSFYILNKSSSISLDYFLTGFILLLGEVGKIVVITGPVRNSSFLCHILIETFSFCSLHHRMQDTSPPEQLPVSLLSSQKKGGKGK